MAALPGGASTMRSVLASRTSGVLQLSGRDLVELPPEAFDPDSATPEGSINWWEVTELTKLVASHNRLTHLQPEVSTLTTLVTLDLGHNQLNALPHSLCELQNLKVLDVTANRFAELPAHLGDLPSLVRLLCGGNSLVSLPPSLGATQPDLAEVAAPGNQIDMLPPGLGGCGSLVKLNLQGNLVSRLDSSILAGMSSLTELNLRQNRISGTLDPAVGSLKAVKVLDLRENSISALPAEIRGCGSLVELLVGHNALQAVPPAIADCPELSVLDVRKNRLTALPPEICRCMRLTLLDLTDNDLSNLPPELGLLTTLRRLPLDGNPLRALRHDLVAGPTPKLLQWLRDKIPDGSGAVGEQTGPAARSGNVFGEDSATLAAATASRLTLADGPPQELVLSGSGLSEVPPEVWEAAAAGLSVLDLSKNKISDIDPGSLARSQRLSSLRLSSNGIRAWPLPQEPGSLPCLRELLLAGNPIARVPSDPFACCAGSLRRIDLSGIPAAGSLAPGALSRLAALEELILCRVSMASFPMDVVEAPLSSLRVLSLQSNAISEIPEAVTRLTNLEELDVSNNDLGSLPPVLGMMTTLRSLAVEGNRLRTIRRPILEKGTKSLLEYLRDRIPT